MSSAALQVHTGEPPASHVTALGPRPSVALIRPIASPAEVLTVQEETRAMVTEILKEGRDYGVIPGTDKPSMLKPGAERTALAFGCYYGDPEIVEREVDHDRVVEWVKRKKIYEGKGRDRRFVREDETRGTSLGLYRYVVRVPVISRETGLTVGHGIGSCSTMESKYIDRPRDSENTALKMAHKRALVSACLVTFGLSDQFTQDVEDSPRDAGDGSEGTPAADEPEAACPKCSGRMWDNRTSKTNPKAPDFKCRDRSCDGVYWAGEWPPAALATDEQKAKITELLNAADIDDKEREKIARVIGSTKKQATAKRADETIAYLMKLVPVSASAAAPAPPATPVATPVAPEGDGLPF